MCSPMLRALRRLPRYRGMLVIMVWQVPVVPEIRPDGSIGFAVGAGVDRLFQLGCDGSVLSSEPYNYRSVAVEADVDLSRTLRMDAAAGRIEAGSPGQGGGFGGAQLRYERPRFGLGAGLAFMPSHEDIQTVVPLSLYMRVGSAERLHFRADLNQPTAQMAQQVGRFGVGWNATRRDRTSGFLALAVLGSQQETAGLAGELTVPLSSRFAGRVVAHAGSREEHSVYGFALGGRYLFGGARPSADRASVTRPVPAVPPR